MGGLADFLNFLPFIAGIAAIFTAAIVIVSGQGNKRFSFGLFALGMGVWAMLISAFLHVDSATMALWIAYGYYIAAAVLIYGFLLFCILFAGAEESRSKFYWQTLYLSVPLLAVSFMVTVPNMFITVRGAVPVRETTLAIFPYLIYAVYFVTYMCASLIVLKRFSDRVKNKTKKLQARLILRTTLICFSFGALFNLILPLFGDYSRIMIGPLFVLPVVFTVFYAMTKHSLFNVRVALIRTIVYVLSIITLASLYYILVFRLAETLFGQSLISVKQALLNTVVVVVLTLLFQPVKRLFDHLTNSIFYRDEYDIDDFTARLGRILTSTSDIETLLNIAASEISTTLKVSDVIFYVYREDGPPVSAGTHGRSAFSIGDVGQPDAFVGRGNSPVVVTELLPEGDDLKSILRKRKIEILLPLLKNDTAIGYLALGQQKSSGYTSRDLRVLDAISDELVIAIQNALRYEQIQGFNHMLQQRIEEATSELKKSNIQLQKLDEAKDEFVSMASHQLRTPLTSVKGYISMVLEGDVGEITPTQRQLLEEAFTSSERMVHLISDFLNVSRLQTGKFVIDKSQVDLAELVKQEVDSLVSTAEAHSLKLRYHKPSHFPVLYLDEGKLRQVVMNFMDNAIYYSPERSTIIVSLTTEDGSAVFTVRDNGIGVPKDQQAHLFTKFFRANNARRQRPDGTGVGLFLAKKVIVAHGGSILFESIEGEGSTFGFRLPIKKLSEAPPSEPMPVEAAVTS